MVSENSEVASPEELERRNRVAQWVFDTLPVLNRFHLWLKDVKKETVKETDYTGELFLEPAMQEVFVMTAAVTALGTRLFGHFGEGKGKDKRTINLVKKDADAISAYAMSESLWHLSRNLPENHAILICLGEGLLPKAGETPDMGANPLLGFGRIYARPQVAQFLEKRIHRLINDVEYDWDKYYAEIMEAGITIWGAAIDTLENTNRFALGAETGPITVLHLFDQPLMISKPYEGYIGNLIIPKKVVEKAEDNSVLINVNTPRKIVLEAIHDTYPGIKNENIHVWTLRGPTREKRIGSLWKEWISLGVSLFDEGDALPIAPERKVFTTSGTYAPTFSVGDWIDDSGETHLFLIDGYAASAEAIQGSTLAKMLQLSSSLCMFSSKFKLSYEKEKKVMHIDTNAPDFDEQFVKIAGDELDKETRESYRELIKLAADSGFPVHKRAFTSDDLFPKKHWDGVALVGYMLSDPYSGEKEVTKLSEDTYRVAVRLVTPKGINRYEIDLILRDDMDESRKIFNPLLDRFVAGENFKERPVKKSDSGRIRNELQTLCSQALEYEGENKVYLKLSKIDDLSIPAEKKERLYEILDWFINHHPMWFDWLTLEK